MVAIERCEIAREGERPAGCSGSTGAGTRAVARELRRAWVNGVATGARSGGGRAEWRWARGVAAGIGLAAKPPFYTIYINVFWSMSIHYRVCVLVAIDWNAAVMSDI